MRHQIKELSRSEAVEVVYKHGFDLIKGFNDEKMKECMATTTRTWVGIADDRVACIWGIILPSLLGNRAYLWLSTSEALKGNEFRFARHSQMVVKNILEEYSIIIGHVRAGQDRSIRWLRWLKAEFGEPEGLFIPFVIRKKI